ncbi:unnamed protein product, partial [Allacma fusca]
RRQRKIEAQDKSHASRKKLIQNLLKQQLQRQYLTDLPATEEIDAEIDRVVKAGSKLSNTSQDTTASHTRSPKKTSNSQKLQGKKDVFEDDFDKFREKLAENFNNFSVFFSELDARRNDSDDSETEVSFEEPRGYDDNFDVILKPSFDELPLEIQHEMLFEMQESRKNNSWGRMDQMPKDLKDFSSFQMERLRKRRTLQKKIQTVQKEMGQRHIHLTNFDDLAAMDYDQVPSAEIKRISSNKEKGLIYIKSSPSKAAAKSEPVAGSSKSQPETITIEDFITGDSSSDESGTFTEEQQLEKAIQLSLEDACGKPKNETLLKNSAEKNQPSLENDCGKPKNETLLKNSAEKNQQSLENDCGKPKNQISVNYSELIKPEEDETLKKPSEDITISDSSSSDFEDVEAEVEEESLKPKIGLKSVIENSPQSLTIAFNACDGFKEEEDIFADVFNTYSSGADVKVSENITGTIGPEKKENDSFVDDAGVSNKEDVIMDSDSDFENVDMQEVKPTSPEMDIHEDGPRIARTLGTEPKSVRMISAQYMQAQERLNRENEDLTASKGFQDRVATSITDQMYSEAQELLTLFGVPYIISPMEAESQCAFLDIACLTEGTITDDSDVWLFGAQRVYKNFFSQGDRKVELYEYADVVQALNMDREKLVLIAILTGSDYTDGVEGVGPVKALEILSEFPSPTISAFDSLMKFREWWDRAQENKKLDSDNKIRDKLRKLKIRPADLDGLRNYTKEKFGWNQQKCDAALLPLIKSLRCQAEESTRQLTMDSFIQHGQIKGSQKKRKIKSKRLEQAMKKLRGPLESSEVKLSSESDSEPETIPPPHQNPKTKLSGSEDEDLDSLLTKMGVKRLKVKRSDLQRGYRGRGTLSKNSNRADTTLMPGTSTTSLNSSSSNSSPAATSVSPINKITKKSEVVTQKARAEFQKNMNKKKAIELLKQKKT